MACLDCGRGFCSLCGECNCCAENPAGNVSEGGNSANRVSDDVGKPKAKKKGKSGKRTRTPKRNDSLKDPHSTGRKRAAVLFPLESDKPCEWQGKAFCGGGKFPIVGCFEGKQEARHHGPDKNTLNNSPQNVHRICHDCHNIWHSENDETYDSYNAKLLHEPRPATNIELINRMVKKIYVATREPQETNPTKSALQ